MSGPNPSGLCMCGCGRPTDIAARSDAAIGWVKGEPKRYLLGHSGHKAKPIEGLVPQNPSGLCMCGCGERTAIATHTNCSRGDVAGSPKRFVNGHWSRTRWKAPKLYVVEDRGYDTACWVWQSLDQHGYGRMVQGPAGARFTGKAHRAFYEEAHGPVPKGLHLYHLCEVRACVNPDHLQLLSPADHSRAHAVLSLDDVVEIRQSNEDTALLAERYGVTRRHVQDIRAGGVWVNAA